jgi:tetratricopeptide (TPR) repeat protein
MGKGLLECDDLFPIYLGFKLRDKQLRKNEMTNSTQEGLSRVELHLEAEEYKEALELLRKIAEGKDLSEEDRLQGMLLESRIKVKVGDCIDAHALTSEVIQASLELENNSLAVDSYLVKTESLWRSGELEKGLEAVEMGMELLEGIRASRVDDDEIEILEKEGEFIRHRGIIYWYMGEFETALVCHQRSLEINKKLGDLPGVASSYNNMGLVYWSKGDLDRSVEYYQRSLKISEEVGDMRSIATSLTNLGNAYGMIGELDQALEVYQRSLTLRKRLDLRQDIAMTLVNIGVINQLKGELDQAEDYYHKSLEISEQLFIKPSIALAINNLGDIHGLKGELTQALEYFQRSFELYEELGLRPETAMSFANIGEIYRKRGELERAYEYYHRSWAIYEEMENDSYIAVVLLDLLKVALEGGNPSLAQNYLEKLEHINRNSDNRVISQRYRIGKAISMKSSGRVREKLEAGRILEKVIEEEIVNHSLTVDAMTHLCDLLLSELKMTGEKELFEDITTLTNRLLEISKEQSSHSLLAETYLLQSKLALIELDMGRASKLLAQALSIAEEKGLNLLTQAVTQERDLLLSQMNKWELIIQEKPSRREMIDVTNIDVLLERMIKKTVASVMEEKGISSERIALKKYELVHHNLLEDPPKIEKNNFRVGIAQIGLSKGGDIIHEFYEERSPGLFGFRKDVVEIVRSEIMHMVETASSEAIDLLIFPELTIDLSYPQIFEDINSLAKTYNMVLIPGSYHVPATKQNLCVIFSPDGILWEQEKHIPAIIHFEGTRMREGITARTTPQKTVIAFTPVTADFKAAHFDARRSIYAYCFFANVGEFGDSLIYTPEKDRVDRHIPAGETGLIHKEVDLFKLRSERKKWEITHAKSKSFIQSTR